MRSPHLISKSKYATGWELLCPRKLNTTKISVGEVAKYSALSPENEMSCSYLLVAEVYMKPHQITNALWNRNQGVDSI